MGSSAYLENFKNVGGCLFPRLSSLFEPFRPPYSGIGRSCLPQFVPVTLTILWLTHTLPTTSPRQPFLFHIDFSQPIRHVRKALRRGFSRRLFCRDPGCFVREFIGHWQVSRSVVPAPMTSAHALCQKWLRRQPPRGQFYYPTPCLFERHGQEVPGSFAFVGGESGVPFGDREFLQPQPAG